MNLITLDFETFFDKDYSLTKLTTEEYVRDPRFKVHCIATKSNTSEAFVIRTDQVDTQLKRRHDVIEWLSSSAILCHHAQFDGLILSHHYNIKPAFWFDTLSMARLVLPHLKSHSLEALAEHFGLPAKIVPYNEFKGVRDLPLELYNKLAEGAKHDVNLTLEIFKRLLPSVPAEELRVIDATIRFFTEPCLQLDKPRLENYLATVQDEKALALTQLGITKEDLQSSAKFVGLLSKLGVAAPTKASLSNPDKMIPALAKTDEGMKQLLEHENETVAALAAARLGQKSTLGETRSQALLGMYNRGALCVYLKYAGAHTTRWSGGDSLNWQNFTRGSEIRNSIIAPPGHRLVIIDLAQIECRVLNWLAGQEDVLETFRAGRDLYCDAASRALGRTITKADKVERQLFKTAELGLGYGMGAVKFDTVLRQQKLEGDAAEMVRIYRSTHPAVTRLWKMGDRVLSQLHNFVLPEQLRGNWGPMQLIGQKIILPNGAALDYSNLTVVDGEYATITRKGTTKIYGAKLVENVVQALSRVVLSQAMLKIIAAGWRIVLTCHDELVMVAPVERAQECLAECLQIMKTPPAWAAGLPLDAEGWVSERYSK